MTHDLEPSRQVLGRWQVLPIHPCIRRSVALQRREDPLPPSGIHRLDGASRLRLKPDSTEWRLAPTVLFGNRIQGGFGSVAHDCVVLQFGKGRPGIQPSLPRTFLEDRPQPFLGLGNDPPRVLDRDAKLSGGVANPFRLFFAKAIP